MNDPVILIGAAALIVALLAFVLQFSTARTKHIEGELKRVRRLLEESEAQLLDAREGSAEAKAAIRRLIRVCERELPKSRPTYEELRDLSDLKLRQLLAELSFLIAESEADLGGKGEREVIEHFGQLALKLIRDVEQESGSRWDEESLLEKYVQGDSQLSYPLHSQRIRVLVRGWLKEGFLERLVRAFVEKH